MDETIKTLVTIGSSLLGGGACGAIITSLVSSHRNHMQPIARRIEVSPLFASGFAGTAFMTSVTVSDGSADYKLPNLHVAELQLVNRGNRDLQRFPFGITLNNEDKAVHVEPYGLDRHHHAELRGTCTPMQPIRELDFELHPFNRRDSYMIKVFIVAGKSEPGPISLSSAEPVRFTNFPSAAEAFTVALSSVLFKVGKVELHIR